MSAAPRSLERVRDLVAPSLAEAAATLSPPLRRMVEYHWGWVEPDGAPRPRGGGKGLRPTLAVLSAEAVGAPAPVARAGAVAVELIHDFTLIHDDVMDDDRERRGRPSVWAAFGVGPALCAGDALVLLAQQVLLRDASPTRSQALTSLGDAAQTVIAGQMLDLGLEGRTDADVDAYLEMAGAKTGALLGCAAAIGAELAGASPARVEALRTFGQALGLAFQAVDDWLGIWGDPARTGKPWASDLRRRKSSLPIVLGLRAGGPEAGSLARLLAGDAPVGEEEVARAVAALEACGAGSATRSLARRELSRARAALAGGDLAPAAHKELDELASFVAERDL